MYDVETTVASQYANSPQISAIINSMNEWIDPTVNLQQFYNYVWNILSAKGFGLDLWGIIIGVSRNLTIPSTLTYFGFNGTSELPFGQAPFYAGQSATQTYALPDSEYLPLLLVKAYANISNCSIPTLNRMLQMLFSAYGTAYVIDQGNMAMTYYFGFALTSVQYAIVANSEVFPHPTGVYVDIQTPADNALLTESSDPILCENGFELLIG